MSPGPLAGLCELSARLRSTALASPPASSRHTYLRVKHVFVRQRDATQVVSSGIRRQEGAEQTRLSPHSSKSSHSPAVHSGARG
jgi:hypothetical protein